MKINLLKKVALVLLVVVLLAACSNPFTMLKSWLGDDETASIDVIDTSGQSINNSEFRDTILYYKDENELLIPVMRKIPWTEGRGIAKEALKTMVDTNMNREDMLKIGLYPVIPDSTEIRGMNISDGLCRVDFSQHFVSTGSKEAEETLVKSVIYTLTEFPTVNEVQILIEGKVIHNMPYGTPIGQVLKRENINFLGKKPAADTVLVFYENSDNLNPMYVPVTQTIEVVDDINDANILDVLDSMMSGPPSESGLQSSIPNNTQVMGIEMTDSIANVHLSNEILQLENDKNKLERAIQSIALTIKAYYSDLKGVKIIVNGKAIEKGDGNDVFKILDYCNQY